MLTMDKQTKKILKKLNEFFYLVDQTNEAVKELAAYYLKLATGEIPPPKDEATFLSDETDYLLPLNVHPEWHESPMFILMALANITEVLFDEKRGFYGKIFNPPVN